MCAFIGCLETLRLWGLAIAVGIGNLPGAIDNQNEQDLLAGIFLVTSRLTIQMLRTLRPDEQVHVVGKAGQILGAVNEYQSGLIAIRRRPRNGACGNQ